MTFIAPEYLRYNGYILFCKNHIIQDRAIMLRFRLRNRSAELLALILQDFTEGLCAVLQHAQSGSEQIHHAWVLERSL